VSVIAGITKREEWGWEPCREDDDVDPQGVTVHWPGDDGVFRFDNHARCLIQVKSWDVYHRSKGSRMLEYGWLICQHLYFIEARSTWDVMISRPGSNGTRESNATRLSLQFMAGGQDSPPTLEEYEAIAESIAHARSQGAGTIIDGHRDVVETECPGDAIYENLSRIATLLDSPPPPPPEPEVEPDPDGTGTDSGDQNTKPEVDPDTDDRSWTGDYTQNLPPLPEGDD